MSKKAMKKFEQAVAERFGAKRVEISDGTEKVTCSQVWHPEILFKCKQGKGFDLVSLWDQANQYAAPWFPDNHSLAKRLMTRNC